MTTTIRRAIRQRAINGTHTHEDVLTLCDHIYHLEHVIARLERDLARTQEQLAAHQARWGVPSGPKGPAASNIDYLEDQS